MKPQEKSKKPTKRGQKQNKKMSNDGAEYNKGEEWNRITKKSLTN
jgi:hypothetical protein